MHSSLMCLSVSTSSTGHQLFGWDFICSDVDVDAVAHARSTVERNSKSLAGHIRIVSVTANSSLQEKVMGKYVGSVRYGDEEDDKECLSGDKPAVEGDGPVLQALRPLLLGHVGDCSSEEEVLQAVMCNPPFYDLTEEVGTYSTSVCRYIQGRLQCDGDVSHPHVSCFLLSLSPSLSSLAVDPPQ